MCLGRKMQFEKCTVIIFVQCISVGHDDVFPLYQGGNYRNGLDHPGSPAIRVLKLRICKHLISIIMPHEKGSRPQAMEQCTVLHLCFFVVQLHIISLHMIHCCACKYAELNF